MAKIRQKNSCRSFILLHKTWKHSLDGVFHFLMDLCTRAIVNKRRNKNFVLRNDVGATKNKNKRLRKEKKLCFMNSEDIVQHEPTTRDC